MASNTTTDPRINITTIIFTPTSTSITDNISIPDGPYLKIQIFPTKNGKDLDSIKILYCNNNCIPSRLNDEICEEGFFRSLVYSLKGVEDTFVDRAASYMKLLPSDEICIIVKEYSKYIQNGVILDGFIAGIGAYIGFLLLNENGIFVNQMPFQFSLPYTVRSGMIVNRNIFQHLSLPLISLSKISCDILSQLVIFIQSFINIWEPLFVDGPTIGTSNEARMSMEIISGFSQYVAGSLAETRSLSNSISKEIKDIESRLQSYIDDSLVKMKREINNLIIETRNTTNESTKHLTSKLNLLDDSVKETVRKTTEIELDQRIKQMIEGEIEASHERIGELVRWYVEDYTRKYSNPTTNDNQNELKGALVGLEHRIEILYNKLASNNSPNILDIKPHDSYRSDELIHDSPIITLQSIGDHQSNTSKESSNLRNDDTINDNTDYSENITHRISTEAKSSPKSHTGRSVTREKVDIDSDRRGVVAGGLSTRNESINIQETIEKSNVVASPLVAGTRTNLVPWTRRKWVGTDTFNPIRSETPLSSK